MRQTQGDVYKTVMEDAEQPVKQRSNITLQNPNGTYRKMKVRKHHLTEAEKLNLIEKSKGSVPNPYKRTGIYKAIVQSLIELGINEYHSFKKVKNQIKEIMSNYSTYKKPNFWEYFVNKKPRNTQTGKDVNGRIIQNIEILQRTTGYHCYGYKLKQLGLEIRTNKENNIIHAGLFKLNN